MKIYIHSSTESHHKLKPVIHELILYACESIGISIEKITSVHIADNGHYAQAISSICANESYSQNEYYLGVGKSISTTVNGSHEHHVVYNICIIAGIISYIKNKNLSKNHIEHASMEILMHEFGHVLDNELRNEFYLIEPLDTLTFSIDKISLYYSKILLSEFFACFHSAFIIQNDSFKEKNSQENLNFENINKELQRLKNTYKSDRSVLRKIAFDSAQFFWIILVQYSKLIAYKLGNNSLQIEDVKIFSNCPGSFIELINELQAVLQLLITLYPVIPDATEKDIVRLWHRTASIFNFSFVSQPQGDAVYFN